MNALSESKPGIGAPAAPAASSGDGESVGILNPLEHPDWDGVLAGFDAATIFHTAAWAQVLAQTYGHVPVYCAHFQGEHLDGLLPVMEVHSFVSGRRGISLPFTDSCPPLIQNNGDPSRLYNLALEWGRESCWRYLECRSDDGTWPGATPSLAFHGHVVELTSGPDALFKNFSDATRRGIRKAQETRLQIEFGSGAETLRDYYGLHCKTRRRQGLPPQPWRFFDNIGRFALSPGHGFIATASLERRPVAAAVFFRHGRQAIYKFGASDYAFQHLRPNNLLMWEAIKRLAAEGFTSLQLGRTSLANEGLRRFKLGFGAREHPITYHKYNFAKRTFVTDTDRAQGWFNRVFRCLPLPVLRLAGQILYPHLS